jgi:hypothetical protein
MIFELIELFMLFPNFITDTNINKFLLDLNLLIKVNRNFSKNIKKMCNDDDLFFYKSIIKFGYHLEENNIYNIYIKYVINEYPILINFICDINIDVELFNLFDNDSFKNLFCLLIFQHLIYKQKNIFKENYLKQSDRENNLLYSFIINNSEIDNIDVNNNNVVDDNIINSDLNLFDKYKFKSLKKIKKIVNTFSKFDDLIKTVPFILKDQIYIKHFYNICILLYTELKDTKLHHSLKMAFIIKKFHKVPKNELETIINIFNYIIISKKLDNYFLIEPFIIDIIKSTKINNYIFNKMALIPQIKTNFFNRTDCINITDYQDTFILFIDFILRNKINHEDTSELFDSIFEASLCDMRSYQILTNDKRRKKIKHDKKRKTEKHHVKYKIIKKNLLENVEEHSQQHDDSSIL